MDFALEPEQEEFRKTVRAFAEEVVAPRAEAMDRAEEMDPAVLDQMAEMGLFGLPFPERHGGMGADYFTLCLAIEELARVDSSVALTLEAAVGLGAMPIWRFGNEQQKQRWLPPLASGEGLGAFGLTEPGGGSDAGALRTRARLEGGQWVIDGTKAFITNAGLPHSSMVTVAAVTGERADGRAEISNIVVPAGTPGYRVGKAYSKIGWHASDTRELVFEDCRVPEENLLGERAAGLAWQRAATTLAAGEPLGRLAAIAKLYASEAAVTSAREAVQVHGGYGYMNEFPVARFYRDAKVLEIGEGTSEVMRILIARSLGLDPGR